MGSARLIKMNQGFCAKPVRRAPSEEVKPRSRTMLEKRVSPPGLAAVLPIVKIPAIGSTSELQAALVPEWAPAQATKYQFGPVPTGGTEAVV